MAAESDFLGVQTYSRTRVGKDGDLPPEPGVELTQMGYEFWPEALEQTIRYAYAQANVPIYVTENGISTEDDARRVEYIRRALGGVETASRMRSTSEATFTFWSPTRQFRMAGRVSPEVRPGGWSGGSRTQKRPSYAG